MSTGDVHTVVGDAGGLAQSGKVRGAVQGTPGVGRGLAVQVHPHAPRREVRAGLGFATLGLMNHRKRA